MDCKTETMLKSVKTHFSENAEHKGCLKAHNFFHGFRNSVWVSNLDSRGQEESLKPKIKKIKILDEKCQY